MNRRAGIVLDPSKDGWYDSERCVDDFVRVSTSFYFTKYTEDFSSFLRQQTWLHQTMTADTNQYFSSIIPQYTGVLKLFHHMALYSNFKGNAKRRTERQNDECERYIFTPGCIFPSSSDDHSGLTLSSILRDFAYFAFHFSSNFVSDGGKQPLQRAGYFRAGGLKMIQHMMYQTQVNSCILS